MSRKQRKKLIRIIGCSLLFAFGMTLHFFNANELLTVIPLLTAYIIIGYDVLKDAVLGILRGQLLDENFLMTIATVGALVIGEYHEAAAVMLFYQIGEWFQTYAVGKSRASISALMAIRPDTSEVERNGETFIVDPEEVEINEIIVIRAGERIPLDGVIVEGASSLDTSALTGESMPCDVEKGSEVISGCINLTGVLRVQTTKVYQDSTVARILELVENASDKKAKVENFITRFAQVYTPIVCITALLLFLIPPLCFQGVWKVWGYRALSFLVVSCPCALVISVPLSFFGGIGAAGKNGILVKGSNYLEQLSKAKIAVFDKTGTLTQGKFKISKIHALHMQANELLQMAAAVESHSNHPISRSVCEAAGCSESSSECSDVQEIAGQGMLATYKGRKLAVGNAKLMKTIGCSLTEDTNSATTLYISLNGRFEGYLCLDDEIKPDTKEALQALRKEGIIHTTMLTGDRESVAFKIASLVGINQVFSQLLPQNKLEIVERMLEQKPADYVLVYVGDGINDAPVLTRADVGIAMGALGSDAAVEAADIVLMDDDPKKVSMAVRIARQTMKIVRQNIVFALGIKLLVLSLVAIGNTGMWLAVFADVGVSVIAILNAMRALYIKQ